MRRGVLIYNPKSGRQRGPNLLPRLTDELRRSGFEVEPEPTEGPADATRIAREHAARGDVEVVFAMGGDGTLREVAAGLLGSDLVLGPLPEGTANVLAFELGLPRTALQAARAAKDAAVRRIDVGFANQVPFLMMASCGIDAAIMAHQDARLKKLFGPAGVAMSGLRRIFEYRYPPFELVLDGKPETCYFFAACNIPFFGGPYKMAPAARTDDGKLDLVTFRTPGSLAALGLAFGVLLRSRHLRRADVEVRTVEEVEVREILFDGLQVDGDVLDISSPIHLRVEPSALNVLSLRP